MPFVNLHSILLAFSMNLRIACLQCAKDSVAHTNIGCCQTCDDSSIRADVDSYMSALISAFSITFWCNSEQKKNVTSLEAMR